MAIASVRYFLRLLFLCLLAVEYPVLRDFLWGKEELNFLLQKKWRRDLNFILPSSSWGPAWQCFMRNLNPFCVCSNPGLKVHWIEPYSEEHNGMEMLQFHLEVLRKNFPLRLEAEHFCPKTQIPYKQVVEIHFILKTKCLWEKWPL